MAKRDGFERPEIEDTLKALKQIEQTRAAAPSEGPSAWDRITAGLKEAAGRSSGWVADRVHDTFQEAVSRFFGLEPQQGRIEQQPQPEPEKGIDR